MCESCGSSLWLGYIETGKMHKKYDVALIELSPEGVLEVCWCETSQTEIF
jgi:hypothetical protein